MRQRRTIQEEVFDTALNKLEVELLALCKSQKAFLAGYRTARLHAFQLEFLSKFLRKSNTANLENFERIMTTSKLIEDRLGAFNELDEIFNYCKAQKICLSEGVRAEDHFLELRDKNYIKLSSWMAANGWWGKRSELAGVEQIRAMTKDLVPLTDKDLHQFAAKKMSKTLRELQDNCDDRSFDPDKKDGYLLSEVESKVHELRREIRKVPMYSNYLKGVFTLTDRPHLTSQKSRRSLKHFSSLSKSALARSSFAQLPKPSIKNPLLMPRPFYVALSKYVSELGWAKDWAQNIERLRQAGLEGEILFNHLDPSLKDAFNRPQSFNQLVRHILSEIRETKIFAEMAHFIEAQA